MRKHLRLQRICTALCCAVLFVSCLTGCGAGTGGGASSPEGASGEAASAEGTAESAESSEEFAVLRLVVDELPSAVDPALYDGRTARILGTHLYAGLARWETKENGEAGIAADGCEALTEGVLQPNGTVVYTYRLKERYWSDGQRVKASDYVYAWNRAVSPSLSGDYAYLFEGIEGFHRIYPFEQEVNAEETLEVAAPDDETLVVTLSDELPYWEDLLTHPAFFPVRAGASFALFDQTDLPLTNGSYLLAEKDQEVTDDGAPEDGTSGRRITLMRNPSYDGPVAATWDSMVFLEEADAEARRQMFAEGEAEIVLDAPLGNLSAYTEEELACLQTTGECGVSALVWRTDADLLPEGYAADLTDDEIDAAKAQIRLSVAALTNLQTVVPQVIGSRQIPATSFVPAGITDVDGHAEFADNASGIRLPSEAEAIEILKTYYAYDEAAGHFTGAPEFRLLYDEGELNDEIVSAMHERLAAYGLTLSGTAVPEDALFEDVADGNYMLARAVYFSEVNDPSAVLAQWRAMDTQNGTRAEIYDELMKRAALSGDRTERYALYHQAEDLLLETGAVIPVFFYTRSDLVAEHVGELTYFGPGIPVF